LGRTRDDLVGGDFALLARLERDEAAADVRGGAAAAAAPVNRVTVSIAGSDFQDLRVAHHLLVDGRERDVLLSDDVGGEPSVVLLRKKPFGTMLKR
jgi:hypothetical protein